MQSILLISQDRKKAKEYIDNFSQDEKIDRIDVSINSFEKTIGIEDIRNIRKNIFLKPHLSKTKIVVIEAYEGITIDSQNALLKILEEPPENTTIIIAISKIGLILPTILSRCKIAEIKQPFGLSKEISTQYLNILVSLLSNSGVGDRLKLAQDIAKNKEKIIPELEKMIIVARKKLIDSACHSERSEESHGNVVSQYLNLLISLNKTYNVLKTTNVNPRLTLENLFLNL